MLKGKKILFTGLVKDKNNFVELKKAGAEIIFFSTIKIVELVLSDAEKSKLKNASNYDYLIFTSVNAVKFFFNIYKKLRENQGAQSGKIINGINNSAVQIIAIGDKTKAAADSRGLKISLMPEKASSEHLDKVLLKEKIFGKKILIPGSKISSSKLRKSLLQKGAVVEFIPVYNTVVADDYSKAEIERIKNTVFDLIVFTSPSTFESLIKILKLKEVKTFFDNVKIASIGPVTKEKIEEYNLRVDVLPKKYNLKSLENKIIKFYN